MKHSKEIYQTKKNLDGSEARAASMLGQAHSASSSERLAQSKGQAVSESEALVDAHDDERLQSSRTVRRFRYIQVLVLPLTLSLFLLLQACGKKTPTPEDSCNFVQNSEQQRVSWGSRVPVQIYIHTSVPTTYFPEIEKAAADWNQRFGRTIIKIAGWTNSPGGPKQDGASIIYLLNTWEAAQANEQARTTVYWAGDQIQEADMRLNGKDFQFSITDTPEAMKVDLRSLVVHEMGHVLGLSHITTEKSVMAKSLPFAFLRREVTPTDLNSLHCEY
jgi:predicted Zn-dependent protease